MARNWSSPRGLGRHLSDETLLAHIDGVIGERDEEAVARHLLDCWQCRTARGRLEDAIGAFMEERREQFRVLEPRIGGSDGFRARLARHASSRAAEKPRSRPAVLRSARRALWPLAATAAALASMGTWTPIRDYVRDLTTPAARPAAPLSRLPVPEPLTVYPIEISPGVAMPSPPLLPPAKPVLPAGPGSAGLDLAELAAYLTLHDLGLCRGNAIEVIRMPGEGILVAGVADWPELAERLKAALAPIPHVQVRLAAPGDELPPAGAESGLAQVLESRLPMLEERLKEHFRRHSPPDRAGRDLADYATQAVRLAGAANAEAQALRKLATVFTVRRLRAMPPRDRARFTHLGREHLQELQRSLNTLGTLLDQLDYGAAAPDSAAAPAVETWEEMCSYLERQTARIDYLAGGLFAGLDLRGLDGGTAWNELRQIQQRTQPLLKIAAGMALADWLESGLESTRLTEPVIR